MLDAKRLGFAGGVLWAVSMWFVTLLCVWTGYAELFLQAMTGVYPGYSISYVGSIVGLIYGFIDGFIGFYLLAWLYNKIK